VIIAQYPPIAIQRCSHLAEPLCAQSAPVRELVLSIPPPRCDHRQHQNPALAKQVLISVPIVRAHLVGRMDDVELDGSTATRLQVYEPQPVLRPEHIARVRLAVQQLLGSAPLIDRPPQRSQRGAQKLPVRIPKFRRVGAVAKQPLRLRDSICEVRRGEINLPHASMQPLERLRILGWCDVSRRCRLVVGPQRDHEAVTHVDARLHPRLKRSHRAIGCGEPPRDLNFERGACLMRHVRDPRKNVTRQEAHSEPVRVVKNDRVIDSQAKR
jgi:hypothetical protein